MKTVILFDLDGTLIDSTEAILESFHKAFEKQGFDFKGTDEDIKNEIGHPLEVMFESLGVLKSETPNFVASYKEHYQTIHTQKTVLIKNAVKAVKLAHEFATLAIVTTKTTTYSRILLEHLGLWQYFDTIIGRQEVENPKPHPEPIFKALENLDQTSCENIYMIGDTNLDMMAAQAAGVNGVAVLCGYGDENSFKPYTSSIFIDPLTAVEYVKKETSH